ncbi:MAG: RnfABCDGE type electron transport complex subunit G [Eubacteriales bacterium]|nr:RnfABCDGE type electron transport complex subunit G [Eubacteriales bacterium]
MKKIIKDACILFAITLIAGILLGIVYDVTKTPIANQNEKAKQEAYKAVVTGADKFESFGGKYAEDKVAETTKALLDASSADYSKDEITEVVVGKSGSTVVGYVITVVAHDGYGGDIKFSVGISKDGEYLGTSILSINETAGLGMRAKQDPSFLNQFNGVNVDEYKVVTDGTGTSSDEAIDAIGGSTVTSKSITKGINAALVIYADIAKSE